MSQVHPVAGNQGFSQVSNTVVQGSALVAAQSNSGLATLYQAKGRVAGNGAIIPAATQLNLLAEDGSHLVLPFNAIPTHIVAKSSGSFLAGVYTPSTVTITSVGLGVPNVAPAPAVAPTVDFGTSTLTAAQLEVGGALAVTAAYAGTAGEVSLNVLTGAASTNLADSIDVTVFYYAPAPHQ